MTPRFRRGPIGAHRDGVREAEQSAQRNKRSNVPIGVPREQAYSIGQALGNPPPAAGRRGQRAADGVEVKAPRSGRGGLDRLPGVYAARACSAGTSVPLCRTRRPALVHRLLRWRAGCRKQAAWVYPDNGKGCSLGKETDCEDRIHAHSGGRTWLRPTIRRFAGSSTGKMDRQNADPSPWASIIQLAGTHSWAASGVGPSRPGLRTSCCSR